MKTNILKSGLYSLLVLLALVSCKKEEPTLKGSASEAAFTAVTRHVPGGDTLPFATYVTFTNTSKDAFSYFWDFGDRTTSVQKSPTHLYSAASNYNVTLRSVGSGGSNTSNLTISIAGPCTNPQFSSLTGCASRSWSLSPVSDAISVLSANGSQVLYSFAPVACQGDDIYTFFADGKLNYNAKLRTYESNSTNNTGTCVSNLQNASRFYLVPSGNQARIILDTTGIGRLPFMGQTDPVVQNSYEILSITEEALTLQGTLLNGNLLRMKFINPFSLTTIKLYLNGGGRRTWLLDTNGGANAVTAGLESNPVQYFGGGALAPCQKDDWYTFTQSDSVVVNCNGSTLLPPSYSCGADKGFRNKISFGPITGSVVGIAQFTLPSNDVRYWIGVFDRSPENVYRILSIDNERMVVRSGDGSGVVHDLKFILKR